MSSVTPTHVLQQAIIAEGGIIIETKDFRKYMLDQLRGVTPKAGA